MSRGWRVAYYDEQEIQICAMYVDGANKLCLDFYGGEFGYSYPSPNFLSWSPDGSRLAIATECNIFIWKVGGEVTPLRKDQTCGIFRDLAWSPAGDYLAYVSQELERVAPSGQVYLSDVFVDSLDGSIHQALTDDSDGGGSPAWSPDGHSLAFGSGGGFFVLSWEGGAGSNLTQLPAEGSYPFWSPDSREIAYISNRDGELAIYSQVVGGGEARKLAEIPIADQSDRWKRYPVAWLPGGTYILYNDRLIDTRTGEITNLQLGFDTTYAAWFTPAETAKAIDLPIPTLSPPTATPGRPTGRTGGKIAYTACSSDAPESCEIFVMNADGSEPTQITQNHAYDGSPDWSPDGQRLVFVSNRDSLDEIYVMDADGSNPVRLTDNTAVDTSPAWSPDGRQIVFVSYRDQASVG